MLLGYRRVHTNLNLKTFHQHYLQVTFQIFQPAYTMNKRKSNVHHAEKPAKTRRTESTTHGPEDEDLDDESGFYQEHHFSTSVCQLCHSFQSDRLYFSLDWHFCFCFRAPGILVLLRASLWRTSCVITCWALLILDQMLILLLEIMEVRMIRIIILTLLHCTSSHLI